MHSKCFQCALERVSGSVFFINLSGLFESLKMSRSGKSLDRAITVKKGKAANGSRVLGACAHFRINHRLSGVLK